MPNIAAFHPQIVHFVVALLLVGVALRIVAFLPRLKWAGSAAALLLLVGTVAAVGAVRSGTDAHGPVERIPGARPAVQRHEEAGIATRNIFLGVAALELIALGLALAPGYSRYARYVLVGSAVIGVWGSAELFEAAEHGGELVYAYGGGPGLRTGNPEDVQRLLLAGMYNAAALDRREHRAADAAALTTAMAQRFPTNPDVQYLYAESQLTDKHDPRAAIAALDSIKVDGNDPRARMRVGSLKADAYIALGMRDSARAILEPIVAASPRNTRLKAKLDSLK